MEEIKNNRRSVLKNMAAIGAVSWIGTATAQSKETDELPIGFVKKKSNNPVTNPEVQKIRQQVISQAKQRDLSLSNGSDKMLVSGKMSDNNEVVIGYAMSMVGNSPTEKIVTAPKATKLQRNNDIGVASSNKRASVIEDSEPSINKFIRKEKRKAVSHSDRLASAGVASTQSQGAGNDSPVEPRGDLTKIGTINAENTIYDYDVPPYEDPKKVGNLQLTLEAWEVDSQDKGYLSAFRATQIPAAYSGQEGESSSTNDFTWVRQYWDKTDLGLKRVKDWSPKKEISTTADIQLTAGVSSDKVSAGELTVDMDVPEVSLDERSTPGETVEQGYQYNERLFNDSLDDYVMFHSLAYAQVYNNPDSVTTCTPPQGIIEGRGSNAIENWGTTLLEAEMKGKFEYEYDDKYPNINDPNATEIREITGKKSIDGKLACFN